MTQTFRTGDRVTIGRFRTNHNYASDDYVGKTATITVVNEEYVRLDIDEGLDSWESKYLTLEQRKNPLLKVGDRVLVTEPTAIQKHKYPACWTDSMDDYIGQVCTVSKVVYDGVYVKLEENTWTWSECNLIPDTNYLDEFCLY